jgi:IMP dehydrogenase
MALSECLTEPEYDRGKSSELEFTAKREQPSVAPSAIACGMGGVRAQSHVAWRTEAASPGAQVPPILDWPVPDDSPPPGVLHCERSRFMTRVAQVLKAKTDQTVYTIAASDSVYNALKLMADKQIGALLVMEGEAIAGIVTERDYARKVVLMDRSSKSTPVRDIMSKAVRFVRPEQTTDECMALMTERRMRHLPVLEHDRLVGMVSIGDLVKNIIAEQQFTIQQLEQYITGAG